MRHNKIKNDPSPKELRVSFFDNLRTFFVFGVVFQHAGMAYIWSDWWPVTDSASVIVACLVALFDGFLMPSLFYIAGFFAIPSIRGKSISQFLVGKVSRLLVPWLVCILFVCPLLPLIYHYTRDGFTLVSGYGNLWLKLMGNAASFKIGILPSMAQVMQNNLFYQRYMWFIGLLAAFFVIFSLIYWLKKEWLLPADQPFTSVQPKALSTLKIALGVGCITFLGSTCLIGLMFALCPDVSDPESWFTFGNIIQFRVSRIFLHATYFILGILTYKKNWLKKGWLPGHLATWMLLFLFVTTGFYVSLFLMRMTPDSNEKLYGLIFWFYLNLFTVSALGLCISTACRYWQRSTPFNRVLASNSYYLYLSHYVFVFFFQLLFIQFIQVPVIIKYLLVSSLALISASFFSRYIIKPYPKLTIVSITAIFLLMISVLHP